MDSKPPATAAVSLSVSGTVSGWSEGARRLLGWAAAEVVGRPVTDLLAEGELPENGGRHRLPLRHRNGATLVAEATTHPLLDAEGRPAGHSLTIAPMERSGIVIDAFDQCPSALGLYDPELRFLWMNQTSSRVIDRSVASVIGKRYRDLFPDLNDPDYTDRNLEVVRTGRAVRHVNYVQAAGEPYAHAWATSMWPVKDEAGRVRGVANWGFDMSAEHWARQRLLLLSEVGSGIGGTLDVLQTARELARRSVPRFADIVTVDLFPEVLRGDEPPARAPAGAVTLTRAALHPGTGAGQAVVHPAGSTAARCLATGKSTVHVTAAFEQVIEYGFGPGLASDPAHWPAGNPAIDESLAAEGLTGRITVPLAARGAQLGLVVFGRGDRPTPEAFTADDLLLAEELATKAAVALDNARRYSRERSTALALQRSLLPLDLPPQEAVEVASRYLPAGAGAGVGGDWFDVIPLSGARVALVVGDVVGHGLHAAASMGRLRTAVRTLADVDLPPDELLTHLDDLVIHLTSDVRGAGSRRAAGEFGATCLYAVYDPVARHCALASAGHPLPLVISPEGVATQLAASPGPPLGLGGLPFEATEFPVTEGSRLALFTDGLVQNRERDVDQGIAELCAALTTGAPDSLEAACDRATASLRPERGTDDAALLLVRTRALAEDQAVTWTLPPDTAEVTRARQLACRQLADWDLEEAGFVTELVVSELVTNAIRYGAAPIRLRLIRDQALICEVSDASSTSPHLRRARAFDEGGRGLMLVAQLTRGWGTRHTAGGKTIWCEQPLPTGCPGRPRG
ncbi:PAS domain-containing protein [Streptomyces sp. 8K308]|uniref:ATP-binding SpoIIE family protein phosphatase n=1 Tax=Streptomyces sp. 8K308 TaxID=2530388 RepID=UPI0010441999|nr:SpoIIE family protein phosphatase [Streptomyces sp. 8K308]TDC22936.1 PAS domain-containing protein [Streptomyces sp. 8K308]